MFKSDCLALFGRQVLEISDSALENLIRGVYKQLLAKISKLNMEDMYAPEEDPKQRTSQMKVQKLLQA